MVTIASSGHHCIVQPQYRVIESGESGWDLRKSWMVSFSIDSTHSLLVKSQEVKSARVAYFQLPLYPTLSSLLQQLVQLVRNPAASHHSTQIAPFQSRLFVFGSTDHFWLNWSLLAQMITFGSNDHFQGAGPALPTERFFFSRRQYGWIKQMVLEPIFTSRKHEVHS